MSPSFEFLFSLLNVSVFSLLCNKLKYETSGMFAPQATVKPQKTLVCVFRALAIISTKQTDKQAYLLLAQVNAFSHHQKQETLFSIQSCALCHFLM